MTFLHELFQSFFMCLSQHALEPLPPLVIAVLGPADLDFKDYFSDCGHDNHEQAHKNIESCESDWDVADFKVLFHINQVEARKVVTDRKNEHFRHNIGAPIFGELKRLYLVHHDG